MSASAGRVVVQPLEPERLACELQTRWLGRSHRHVELASSTNDLAAAWRADPAGPAPHGAVVTASRQTAGRGRHGRAWASDVVGDLYVSLVLAPPGALRDPSALALTIGLGIRRGLGVALPGLEPRLAIKWPNDVLCDERKLAGVLCESRWHGRRCELVAGFGIDLVARAWPPELAEKATSCAEALAAGGAEPTLAPPELDASAVLARILEALEAALEIHLARGFGPHVPDYRRSCATIGRRVTIEPAPAVAAAGLGRWSGRAVDVDRDGALWVAPEPAGPARRVDAGEVSLRPADR